MLVAEVDGVPIAYRRTGAGPPLVLLHGAISDSRAWRPQLEALADAFTVVAWDAPGSGSTPDPRPPYGTDEWADALAGFLDVLALGPAHVCGFSWGSTLALALVDRRPDLVATLILVGAYAGWKGSLPPEECAARLAMALESAALPPAQLADRWLPSVISEAADPARIAEVRAIAEDAHPEGLRLLARSMAATDLRAVLPRIAVPVLLVTGEHDLRSPPRIAEALRAAIPGARLVVVPGSGHEVNVERPREFDDAIRGFCAGSRP